MIIEEEPDEISKFTKLHKNQLKPAGDNLNEPNMLSERDIDFIPIISKNSPKMQKDLEIFQKILFKTIKNYCDSVDGSSIIKADFLEEPIIFEEN
jgi:hypothetical protein